MRNIKRFLCILAALQAVWGVSAKKAKKQTSIDKAKAAAPVVDMVQEAAELQAKADAGDAEAQRELGIHYHYGWGVARDLPVAASLFKQAAEAGDVIATRRLGLCYGWGDGVAEDPTLASFYYMKAANAGDGIAQHLTGSCYEKGFGVMQNNDEAAVWYNKSIETLTAAAEAGDKEAAHYLGLCYVLGYKPVKQSNAKGMKLWRQAAETGYIPAMNNVGWYYAHNAQNEADVQQAIKWLKQSADLGDMTAQYNIANFYTDTRGIFIRTDWKKGIEYYTKSAEQGYADAQYELGLCYRNGNGVEKNWEKALLLLNDAAKQGHKKAAEAYKNMVKE